METEAAAVHTTTRRSQRRRLSAAYPRRQDSHTAHAATNVVPLPSQRCHSSIQGSEGSDRRSSEEEGNQMRKRRMNRAHANGFDCSPNTTSAIAGPTDGAIPRTQTGATKTMRRAAGG